MIKDNPKTIFAWTMFDFANTSFTIIVITVVFPLFFKNQIVDFNEINVLGFKLSNPEDLLLGMGASISFFVVALTAPILGALSDLTSRKKKYIFYYSIICILATFGMSSLENGQYILAIFLLVLGNVGFETGIIYYDAFLPVIASEKNYSKYSGFGFAAGYLGAILSLLMSFLFITDGNQIDPNVFTAASIFFLISSLPFFLIVKEEKKERVANFSLAVKASVNKVLTTIRNFKKYPAIRMFMISFFFYINGVLTIIAFGGVYASTTLGFSTQEVIIFFALVQFCAMIGSFLFGYLGGMIGEYVSLKITLFLWILVCLLAFASSYVSFKKELFYFVGVLAGLSLGSCQSLSRSYFASMIPKGMEAEFFGFYALSGRFAAILGPLVFGLTSAITGVQEYAVLSVLLFFGTGYLLLKKVPQLLDLTKENILS